MECVVAFIAGAIALPSGLFGLLCVIDRLARPNGDSWHG